jgi:hypothetical protein
MDRTPPMTNTEIRHPHGGTPANLNPSSGVRWRWR